MSRAIYEDDVIKLLDKKWKLGQYPLPRDVRALPSAEPEPKCNSCRYRNLEWYKEPCDSCTGGGKNCYYKPEPERLTDDDFETIRIHLNAYKEKLCNQRRWEEAEDYERLINRFISFAFAQPEIIRCKDCKYAHLTYDGDCKHCDKWTDEFGIPMELYLDDDFYCGYAKRRRDEHID